MMSAVTFGSVLVVTVVPYSCSRYWIVSGICLSAPLYATIWVVAAAGALVWIGARSPAVRERLGLVAPQHGLVATSPNVATPTMTRGEIALVRARTLYARGRLAEALQVFDRVDANSAQRSAADALRMDIEHLLLAGARDRTTGATVKETGRP